MILILLRPLTVVLATVFFAACSENQSKTDSSNAKSIPEIYRPTLSFYHIPNCFLCQELSATLSELEKQHGRFMNFRTVDYHLPASQERIHKAKLGSHGILISNAEGLDLWSMSAHVQGKDELAAAVNRLTSR